MSCCQVFVLTVIGNNALATPTASPVVLTVDRPITDMPANGCFIIRINKAFLRNVNANAVQITDGTTTVDVLTCCTDPLRYDSLVAFANETPCRACVRLAANRRTQPAPGHIALRECVPLSSFTAPAAAAPAGN